MKKLFLNTTTLTLFILLTTLFTLIFSNRVEAQCSLSWSATFIDTSGEVGRYNAIAVDSGGQAHISYYDKTNGDLKYATNPSATWGSTFIDTANSTGKYTSISVDSGGQLHISYSEATSYELKYATNPSGTWGSTVIDASNSAGNYTSITVDSGGQLHISYNDGLNDNLNYATNPGGAWSFTYIDTVGSVGDYTSIAVDSSGQLHISYYDTTNLDLKYATNPGGAWGFTSIDTVGSVGQYNSIAVDSGGQVHISYFDGVNGDLKYATNPSATWGFTSIDTLGSVGHYTSIAVDSGGQLHISYYDDTNGKLKYATNPSGTWGSASIDTVSTVGENTSITVDSSSQLHISYWEPGNSDLKYAAATYPSYTLTVSVSGSGSVTSSDSEINCGRDCTETFACSNSITLTATADTGYEFTGWSGGSCSGAGTCTLSSLTADTTETAVFTASASDSSEYVLTVTNSAGGTVTSSDNGIDCGSDCTETYTSTTSVTLTATPSSGYGFCGWSGGVCSGTGTCTLSLSADTDVTATFTYGGCYNSSSSGSFSLSTYLLAKEAYKSTVSNNISDVLNGMHPLIMTSPNTTSLQDLKFCFADSKGGFNNATSGYTYYLAVWKDTTGATSAEYTADNLITTGELLPVLDSAASRVPISTTNSTAGCLIFSGNGNLQYDIAGSVSDSLTSLATTDKVILMHLTGDTSFARYSPASTFTIGDIGFNWYLSSGLSESNILNLQVIENNSQTYESTFAEFKKQYIAGVTTEADGVIDINSERKRFQQNITSDIITVTIADRNAVTTTSSPYYDGEDYTSRYLLTQSQGGGSVADILIDIEADNQAISKVVTEGTTLTYDSNNNRWRITSDVSMGSSAAGSFKITINESNVIDTRKFKTIVNSVADTGYTSYTYLDSNSAGAWSLNAYQGIIPYILTLGNHETFCIVANNSGSRVDVFFDIISSEGSVSDLINLDLGEIEDNSLAFIQFDGTEITLMDKTLTGATVDVSAMGSDVIRYAGKIIITGNKDNLWTSCMQRQGGSPQNKRFVPVLTDRTTSGAQWGQ